MKPLLKINPLGDISLSFALTFLGVGIVIVVFILLISPFVFIPKSLEGKILVYLPKYNLLKYESESVKQIYLTYDKEQRPGAKVKLDNEEYQDWESFEESVSTIYIKHIQEDKDIEFSIDGDDNVPFQEMINALDTCRKAGIDYVFLSPWYKDDASQTEDNDN